MAANELKHQVKPLRLNEKIFQPLRPLRRSVRPPLVPEPFHLTEVFKKPAVPKEEPYRFSAKPVPKTILQKPIGVGKKPEVAVTVPQSPAITKSARHVKPVKFLSNDNKQSTEDLHSFGVPYYTADRKTEVKPFSFEMRDKQMIERREKKIQELLQAEKKAREFKANPVPAFSVPKEVNRSSKQTHLDCSKSSIALTDEGHQPFRARSPRVLRKAPFEPKLQHAHSQTLDVQLWTERRAQNRQDYEIKQLEKQERLACLKEQVELEKKQKEEEEILRMRKETVHKAQPVPKYKEKAQPKFQNLPLTSPMSSRFSKRTRVGQHCTKSLHMQ